MDLTNRIKRPLSRVRFLLILATCLFTGMAMWALQTPPQTEPAMPTDATAPSTHNGPPWRYGKADARYTLVEYADLECPFCQAYFPVLRQWIDANPEANWQWHHLPLQMHEPAASREARLAECAGEAGGQAAFWQAVEWIYTHTRSEGQGLPENTQYPGITASMQRCLDSDRADAVIRAQSEQAGRDGITATPTLRLKDNATGKTLLLHGPVEGDALLSALDMVSTNEAAAAETTDIPMPADVVGDMPR